MAEKQRQNDIELIPLAEAAKLTGYTPEYLNLLSRKGKLKAEKIGRNWYTKIEWVNLFLAPIPGKSNESSLITLSEASKLTGYTPEYLNSLARSEKLKAKKIGRNWHTKKVWLDEFLAGAGYAAEAGIVAAESDIAAENIIADDSEKFSENFEKDLAKKDLAKKDLAEIPVPQTRSHFMQIFAGLSSALIIIPLIFAATIITKKIIRDIKVENKLTRSVLEDENLESVIVNENYFEEGLVAAEEDTANPVTENKIMLASENFKIKNINVGGDIIVVQNGDNLPLEIFEIKSESFVAKKDEVKLVVSWKTNKLAKSEISYAKNNGANPKSLSENSYGFTHSVLLADLEPRTSYIYQIIGKDRWGNSETSNNFGIYTASKPVSVFDLISNALGEVFGWAIKK